MTPSDHLLELFRTNHGYLRSKDALTAGIHHTYMNQLLNKGEIVKVRRGLYRLVGWGVTDELETASQLISDGILCLYSAWNYYELSDHVPAMHHIAIEKSRKLKLPEYPPVKLYYWSAKNWEVGQTTVTVGNTPVTIYTRERCVVDAIRFQNKVGLEVTKEVVQNYLKQPGRDLDQVISFARQLRANKKVKEYISLLV